MTRVLEIAIPAVSFLLLALVGFSLTREGLAAALRSRKALALGTVLPWLASPVLGWTCVALFPLTPDLAACFLLISACPTGSIANVHTLLARGNVALAVPLSVLSVLLSWGLTPALLALLSTASPALASASGISAKAVALHAGLFLVLPAV